MSNQAITVLLLVLCLIIFIAPFSSAVCHEWKTQKEQGKTPQFDERQKLARLRASRRALWSLMGYMAVWAVLDAAKRFSWTGEVFVLITCGLYFALVVWQADCILHDAAVGWNQKTGMAWIYLYFLATCLRVLYDRMGADETLAWVAVICMYAGLLAVAVIDLYAYRRAKKRARAAEAEAEDDTL